MVEQASQTFARGKRHGDQLVLAGVLVGCAWAKWRVRWLADAMLVSIGTGWALGKIYREGETVDERGLRDLNNRCKAIPAWLLAAPMMGLLVDVRGGAVWAVVPPSVGLYCWATYPSKARELIDDRKRLAEHFSADDWKRRFVALHSDFAEKQTTKDRLIDALIDARSPEELLEADLDVVYPALFERVTGGWCDHHHADIARSLMTHLLDAELPRDVEARHTATVVALLSRIKQPVGRYRGRSELYRVLREFHSRIDFGKLPLDAHIFDGFFGQEERRLVDLEVYFEGPSLEVPSLAAIHQLNESWVFEADRVLRSWDDLSSYQLLVRHFRKRGLLNVWLAERRLEEDHGLPLCTRLAVPGDLIYTFCQLPAPCEQERNLVAYKLTVWTKRLPQGVPPRFSRLVWIRIVHALEPVDATRLRATCGALKGVVGYYPEICLVPDGIFRRELAFRLLCPTLREPLVLGCEEVWRNKEVYCRDQWPMIALTQQPGFIDQPTRQLDWMLTQDWKGVPRAKELFKAVAPEFDVLQLSSALRNSWTHEERALDNLERICAVAGGDVVHPLVDQTFGHRASLHQLVELGMTRVLTAENWNAIGERLRGAAKSSKWGGPLPQETNREIRALLPKENRKKEDIDAWADQHRIHGGFAALFQLFASRLDKRRTYYLAERAFSKEQLQLFLNFEAVRLQLSIAIQNWPIKEVLGMVRMLSKSYSDWHLTRFVTLPIFNALFHVTRKRISSTDRVKIYSLWFRSGNMEIFKAAYQLPKAVRQALDGKYDWMQSEVYRPVGKQKDPLPLAALVWHCKAHGGANDFLDWLKGQEWKEKGRAPHAISKLERLIEKSCNH